ncbi:MAG: phosphotransferase family protein [Planctomycetota bacterium]
MLLPRVTNYDEYRPRYGTDEAWLPALRTICQRHGLDPDDLRREPLGSHVVFRTGDRIVKLFCPIWRHSLVSENAGLGAVTGCGLDTPELTGAGELEGWPYLIMTIVPGVPAISVWKELDPATRERVVTRIGETMGALHEIEPPAALAHDWNGFLAERIAGIGAQHDAAEPFRSWIRARVKDFAEPTFEPVLLHADVTDDHILLSEQDGRWEVTGLIDFGDAMAGHRDYEFIAPLAFYTLGEPALSRRLVEAYGLDPTPELADRLTTYCLLHKFGKLDQLLERAPCDTPHELERALWGDLLK